MVYEFEVCGMKALCLVVSVSSVVATIAVLVLLYGLEFNCV